MTNVQSQLRATVIARALAGEFQQFLGNAPQPHCVVLVQCVGRNAAGPIRPVGYDRRLGTVLEVAAGESLYQR